MQDLSSLAADSMWPTSQSAGNRSARPDAAMTAPGSAPVDRELAEQLRADPAVEMTPHARTVIVHGGARPDPWVSCDDTQRWDLPG